MKKNICIIPVLFSFIICSCGSDDRRKRMLFSEEELADCQVETINGSKQTQTEFLVSNTIVVDGETKYQKLYFKVDYTDTYTLRFVTELNTDKNVYPGLIEPLDSAKLLFTVDFLDGILPHRNMVSEIKRVEPENFINNDTIIAYEFIISEIGEEQVQRFLKSKIERIVFGDFANFLSEEKTLEVAKQMTCASR